jgi:hypothetical protein
MLLVRFAAAGGRTLWLCDFGSAGEGGTPYRSWLAASGLGPEARQCFDLARPGCTLEPGHFRP